MTTNPATKPSFFREPWPWLRRKLNLKLNDALRHINLRVLDRVDFTALRSEHAFAHILDVGVADGTDDLYDRYPNAVLELFEPSPQHAGPLRSGILSRRDGRLHPVALGAAADEATLFVTGRSGSTMLEPGRDVEKVTVPVKRLDTILRPDELKRPCLLKIDTEGFELDVLRGAESLLPHVDCVVVEVHFDKPNAYAPADIFALLDRHGFELADMLDHHVRNRRVVCADMVFNRKH